MILLKHLWWVSYLLFVYCWKMEGSIDLSKRIILGFTYCLWFVWAHFSKGIKEEFFFSNQRGEKVVLLDESLLNFL